MKRIYVVGPITGKNDFETSENINSMVDECQAVVDAGYAVYFPFTEVLSKLNSNNHSPIKDDDSAFEWLKVSDGLLLVGDWSKSDNCMKQVEVAEKLNIPVFFDIPAVIDYFELSNKEDSDNEEIYPSSVIINENGLLGLYKGDILKLNKDEDRYEFKSEVKHANGMYEKRTAAISTSLYSRLKNLFTI